MKHFARQSSIYFQSVLRQRRFVTVLCGSMAATLEFNLHAALNLSDTAHVRLRHNVNEAVICKTVNPSTLLSINIYLLPFWAPFRPSVHTKYTERFHRKRIDLKTLLKVDQNENAYMYRTGVDGQTRVKMTTMTKKIAGACVCSMCIEFNSRHHIFEHFSMDSRKRVKTVGWTRLLKTCWC